MSDKEEPIRRCDHCGEEFEESFFCEHVACELKGWICSNCCYGHSTPDCADCGLPRPAEVGGNCSVCKWGGE
jgi:hypothetical protein